MIVISSCKWYLKCNKPIEDNEYKNLRWDDCLAYLLEIWCDMFVHFSDDLYGRSMTFHKNVTFPIVLHSYTMTICNSNSLLSYWLITQTMWQCDEFYQAFETTFLLRRNNHT